MNGHLAKPTSFRYFDITVFSVVLYADHPGRGNDQTSFGDYRDKYLSVNRNNTGPTCTSRN